MFYNIFDLLLACKKISKNKNKINIYYNKTITLNFNKCNKEFEHITVNTDGGSKK